MRCVLISTAAVFTLYLGFLGVMALITPIVNRALTT